MAHEVLTNVQELRGAAVDVICGDILKADFKDSNRPQSPKSHSL